MIVYISGKIVEEVISDATRQKFAQAEGKISFPMGTKDFIY